MKFLRIVLIGILTFVLLSGVNQYLFCPSFNFPAAVAFSGDSIYNPYQSMNPGQWVKCNFHAHAKAWNGVTNGHGTAAQVHKAYQALNYGIHCVSNYQCIDSTNTSDDGYIPAYEHGYNMQKTHQLILGDQHVEWLDYLLPQTIDNKQDILNHIKNPNSLVVLNHPALRNGYPVKDLLKLTNYDCMEVLNPSVVSTNQWDAALSAGHKVFIVGDDDLHNVIEKDRLGKICTFVNVSRKKKKLVLDALKSGDSYGVIIGDEQKIDSIPFFNRLRGKQKHGFHRNEPACGGSGDYRTGRKSGPVVPKCQKRQLYIHAARPLCKSYL